jgi:hypothetical protein
MSRVSRKSELSSSITKGSGAIDLGKNSGVDTGRKSEPSLTSGGIGITQEVTNVGGMSVSVGGNIDITPVDFGITIDSEGTVSIATGAEIPGGLLGVSGGIEIDLNTGEVIGGSIGGEVGGLGINLSNSKKGGLGIEFTLQIPGTPIELSVGFGFPPKKPTPSPTPAPSTPSNPFNPENLQTSFDCPNGSWEVGVYAHVNFRPRLFLFDEGFERAHERYVQNSYNPFALSEPPSIMEQHIAGANARWGGNWATEEYESEKQYINAGVWIFVDSEGIWRGVTSTDQPSIRLYRHATRTFFYPTASPYRYEDRYFWGFESSPYNIRSVLVGVNAPPACPRVPTPSPAPSPAPSPTPSPAPSPSPFPNPPPRKQKKMDACCRENLKFLRAIYTGLGIAKFPGQLPATIIQEVAKEGEAPAEPPQVPIADFVDLLDWQFRRDDERWGQWEIQINVKDGDLTKEGDQGKQIKFPNLAESIAELEGQMLSVMANVDALVAITTKNLVESGMARQEAIKGYLAAKAIIKYMAFKSTEVDFLVPMTFTPGAETISALIQESEGHVKGTDYVEKETLRDILLDLLQAAAVTRAVHWQKIDSKNDTKTQLLNLLKGTVDLAGLVNSPKKSTDGEEKKFDPAQNFEDFIDSVEDGFRNTTGITDIENPYGKTPDRRPRIRQIGDNISQAGGND